MIPERFGKRRNMKDTSYILIELMLRQMIKKYKDDPKRSVRNLIDMAQNFAKGRFQRRFFEAAYSMLNNEESAYYELVDNVLMNVDTDRLITLGMNIGYNSCTKGAGIIREKEAAENFDIPWSMSLEISPESEADLTDYIKLVEQGKNLGIYTWMIFADHRPEGFLDIISQQTECAFVLFCEPDIVTEEFLDEISPLKNLMLCIHYTERTEPACEQIHSRAMPCAVYLKYSENNIRQLLDNTVIHRMEHISPMLCVLVAEKDCPTEVQKKAAEYAANARMSQQYPFIVWEYLQDGMTVDTIISDDPCSAYFDGKGYFHSYFHSYSDGKYSEELNFHNNSFRYILSKAFYKSR